MEKSRWRSPDPAPTPECFAFAPSPKPGGGEEPVFMCGGRGVFPSPEGGGKPVFEEGEKVREARRGDKCRMQNAERRMNLYDYDPND